MNSTALKFDQTDFDTGLATVLGAEREPAVDERGIDATAAGAQ